MSVTDQGPANRDAMLQGVMVQGAALHRAAQVRAADTALIGAGIAGYELMCRAARGALRELQARWPVARDLLIVCGAGNNGGDGYALARLALARGLSPRVIAVTPLERLRGDAARAAAECVAAGVPVLACVGRGATLAEIFVREYARCDVLIDALLGIGLIDAVRGDAAVIIKLINATQSGVQKGGALTVRRPVVALDVPSGLCADTGKVQGDAVRADLTVTFILHKTGLFLEQGPVCTGALVLDDLDANPQIVANAAGLPVLRTLEPSRMRRALSPRARAAHKGEAGHVLVIGGGAGMPGAARLAGEAALRAGAGRVTVLCHASSAVPIAAGCPELMVRAIGPAVAEVGDTDDHKEIVGLVAAVDVLAIGPGLGQTLWARRVFTLAMAAAHAAARPTIIDADALNLLADDSAGERWEFPRDCVLTPHPGEAGRLLGITASAVQADRLGALQALRERYPATIVLKGAGSLVSDHQADRPPWLCTAGNPAMAAPGMGDVLTGVIAALLGQGLAAAEAAQIGVLWHALAGDAAAAGVDRGLLAGEVSACLPIVIRAS